MRGVFVAQFSLACGVALVGGCGGTAVGVGQSGGTGGDAAVSGGTDGGGTDGSGTAGTGDAECVDGTERCPCYGNGTCNEGLICASDLCVHLRGGGLPGAAGSGGGEASCSNVTPCGGDLVGTWNVTSSCLTVSGDLSVWYLGLDRCESVPVTGILEVTGTLTANADGTYSDNTTTRGEEQIDLPSACLEISGTRTTCARISAPLSSIGFASVGCADNAATGGCTCSATIDQAGGIGAAPMYPSASGAYTAAGSTLMTTTDEQEYSYCVSETTLTVTPLSPDATGTLTGTVVLQRQ
jgi:hypothetical protein